MLDPAQCRVRQRRLLEHLAAHRLDAVVIGWPPHVYYLSAFLTGWLHQSALVLLADGRTWLATATTPAQYTAADQVVSYEAQWFATQRQEQPAVVAGLVAELLRGRGVRNVGTDASLVTSQLPLQYEAHFEPID